MNAKIKVIIADDHPLIRYAIRLLLAEAEDLEVVGEASDGIETIEQVTIHPADILLLDVMMPQRHVLEVLTTVQEINPTLKVVLISAHYDPMVFHALLDAGMCGYLLKEEASDVLVPMIRAVQAGDRWFSEHLSHLLSPSVLEVNPHRLTDREVDILEALAQGMTNYEISQKFKLVAQTVRNYTSRIYEKLEIQSRGQAIIWVATHGLPTKPSTLLAQSHGEVDGIFRE
jgi:DNA-binding NarL/FixJ family response regulator